MKRRFAFFRPQGTPGSSQERTSTWLLLGFLCLVFLTGGGSRRDIASLALLRPVAVFACFIALVSQRREQVRAFAVPVVLIAGGFTLALLQLVPLPPAWWQALSGREVIVDVTEYAGLGGIWRPLSMDPIGTRNALFSLFVPAFVGLIAIQLAPAQRIRVLLSLLAFGLASAVLAGLQLGGEPDGPLYLYRITNSGAAVGLFANRNHQALMLAMMLPLLAYWASLAPKRSVRPGELGRFFNRAAVAAVMAILAVAMLLITGSRAGLLLAFAGLVFVPWLGPQAPVAGRSGDAKIAAARWKRRWWYYLAGLAGLAAITAYALSQGQAEALNRLFALNLGEDDRAAVLPQLLDLVRQHWLTGSGFGSFEAVYKIAEPGAQLSPFYLNHAHDDWLEMIITGGLPAILLFGWLLAAIAMRAIGLARQWISGAAAPKARLLAFVMLLQMAVASIGDYPLRTPAIACLFMLALVVFFDKSADLSQSEG